MTDKLFDVLWAIDLTITIVLKIIIILGIIVWLFIQWKKAYHLSGVNSYLSMRKDDFKTDSFGSAGKPQREYNVSI